MGRFSLKDGFANEFECSCCAGCKDDVPLAILKGFDVKEDSQAFSADAIDLKGGRRVGMGLAYRGVERAFVND